MRDIKTITELILDEAEKIIKGKRDEIKLLIMSMLAGGHVLIDDVPGTGKTTLVKIMAKTLGCEARRIQFVSDSMPSDIIGMNIYNQKQHDFQLRKGPVFTNILLADEINRAMPRTQSALLEAMEEKQVTIDGEAYMLPKPFLVVATENPVEYESTFNLPIAQLDRFFIKLSLGYPSREDEKKMLMSSAQGIDLSLVNKVIDGAEFLKLADTIGAVHIEEKVLDYIIDLVNKTRSRDDIAVGASPRATKNLFQASKTWAAMQGRNFVIPDDVQKVAPPVLSHRLVVSAMTDWTDGQKTDMVKDLLEEIEIEKD